MFKSYLTVALRNISKHKYFSVINVIGLALGMSFSLLLLSFYSYVCSFDDFHSKKERIYRVISTLEQDGTKTDFASAPAVLANSIQSECGGIDEVSRINASFKGDVVTDKSNIPIQGYYVDANFFSVFDFELIQGNPVNALSKPNSMVLTESVAKKFKASGDLVGNVLEIKGIGNFEVTGIVKDEKRSHLVFEALLPFGSLPAEIRGEDSDPDQWTHFKNQYIYLLTDGRTDRKNLQLSLHSIGDKVSSLSKDAQVTFKLQSLGEITPGPDLENSIGWDTDYTLIIVFAVICLLILIPACFNYANISIARALARSKEIGLRKTLGGVKAQIFLQFITETIAIMLISLVAAFLIFIVIRPEFEDMMPGGWLDLSLTGEMLILFFLFAVIIGFLAGVFPALYFAGLNPIQAFKGKLNPTSGVRMSLRKVLIIFQFVLSFCFIVLLLVFSRQYRYTLNFDYGFKTENILDVELQGVNTATFIAEFSRLSEVQDLSMSSGKLGLSYSSTFVRKQSEVDSLKVAQLFVDSHYIQNMGLEMVAGQNFQEASSQNKRNIIVNEEFLRSWQMGSPTDALGKTFIVEGESLQVIGVLKNFHYASLQEPIKSFFFRSDPAAYTYANLKVASNDIQHTMATMKKVWSSLSSREFEGHFFEDEMEAVYHFYRALLKMIGFLGIIAISVTLLGLLGMVVYTMELRTREVGIRKIFGAQQASITYLLSKDFLILILWAAGLAIPITIFFVNDILSLLQYYRVSLHVWDMVLSLMIFLLVGVGTIASQTWRTARTNPIKILRDE